MNIAHIIHSLDPAGGGPAAVVARLAAAQGALGHQTHVLTIGNPARAQAVDLSLRNIPGIAAVERHNLPPVGLRDALRADSCPSAKAWHEAIAPMDVLHLHGVWEPLLLMAARMADRMGKPYVIAPHGMLDPWSLKQKALKKKIALALGYRRMLNDAAFLHVLNRDEAALLEPLKLICPLQVIPNGIFPQEIDPLPAPGDFRRLHPELGDHPYILFLSRLHYKKGLDYLADAFADVARAMPDLQLVVAGPDGGEQAPFEERIGHLGLSDRTYLSGPLYGRDKFAALVDAACFCLPSRQEGFSMAITEALACGTPVVISENCHFPEVAEAGAGRVVPLAASAAAAALLEILQDAHLRRRMADAGRQLVLSRYTWPAIAGQTIEAYENSRR